MKKGSQAVLFPALLLLFGWASPANGQGTYLGVRGGISVTDYSLPYLSEDWRAGPVAGAFLSIPFGSYLSAQPELSFVRKGAEWFKAGSGPTRGDLDYVEALLSARVSLPLRGGFSLNLLGGPSLGVLLKCGTDALEGPQDCRSVLGDGGHKKTDFGWSAGLGTALRMGPWISQLDLRWSRGVFGILENRPHDNPSTRSTQLSLGIGYMIS